MWTCTKCGEQHEDHFDSCWKCTKAEPAESSIHGRPPEPMSVGFGSAWCRGWLILVALAMCGVVMKVLIGLAVLALELVFPAGDNLITMALLAAGIFILPAWAYWVFDALAHFFQKVWSPRPPREMPREERAFVLLEEASKLETRGRVKEALAQYQTVVEKFAGTAASRDAQKSIESLRAKVG